MADQVERVTTTETRPADGSLNRESVTTERTRQTNPAARIISFIAGVIITLITLRFILLLLEANQGNGFVDFILAVTDPLVAPFNGIFGNPSDTVRIEPQSIVAVVVYGLVAYGLMYLVRSAGRHSDAS
jgi:uncharacterized protein YggT (Ycf19 family)